MSQNQPTALDILEQRKQTIHDYLNLLKKHEPNWNEPAKYSATKTRRYLNRQLNRLNEIISWVKE